MKIIGIQYDLFENDSDGRITKSYLERLAGTCGHISSFGVGEFDNDPLRNFLREDLHIRVISDHLSVLGEVNWKNKKVFSYSMEEVEAWDGKEDWETIDYFDVGTYVPGRWENLINKLYEESTKGILTSD